MYEKSNPTSEIMTMRSHQIKNEIAKHKGNSVLKPYLLGVCYAYEQYKDALGEHRETTAVQLEEIAQNPDFSQDDICDMLANIQRNHGHLLDDVELKLGSGACYDFSLDLFSQGYIHEAGYLHGLFEGYKFLVTDSEKKWAQKITLKDIFSE